MNVDSSDVIKLILQFLRENNLHRSLQALQDESMVTLNTVDSVATLIGDVHSGQWDAVLSAIANIKLPHHALFALHEQMVLEFVELRETDICREIMRRTEAMVWMKQEDPERYLRLEHLINLPYLDLQELYPDMPKEKKRANLAKILAKEVSVVPPARLLALLNQALKWQQHQGLLPPGSQFDLFRGTAPAQHDEEEKWPTTLETTVRFSEGSHAECAHFTADAQSFITGSSDGFAEVWNYVTGKLRTDLKYQADDNFMLHDEAILALDTSSDSEMLATGSAEGKIKVWHVTSGKCLRRFDQAHSMGVTCVRFAKDNSHVLSASFDQTARLHGLKSGKTLKIFRGHTYYVNHCIFSEDGLNVVTCGSDGTVKVWDAKTTDVLCSFYVVPQGKIADVAVNCVFFLPHAPEQVVVCNRTPTLTVFTLKGQLIKKMTNTSTKTGNCFVDACASPRGELIYAMSEEGVLCCFNSSTGELCHTLKACDKDGIGVCHHPHRNLIATFGNENYIRLWKP